jgi:Ca-activated chloride channel family protein
MPFATPLALLGLAFIPAVVAMYLLKLRRDEAVVPSTLLWSRLVADVEANAPWQRLRRSALLILQLLLVVILALLAARPFLDHPAGLARNLVLVVDASASMAATDVVPNRLEVAKQKAVDALRDLPSGGMVSVIAAGETARVVSTGTSDLGRVRQAIKSIQVTPAAGNLVDALTLADALAARAGDAEILVATDAAVVARPSVRLQAKVHVLQVGRDRKNQAIVALAIRAAPSGLTKSAFISVANLSLEQAKRRLEVYADGALVDTRDVYLDPQARASIVVDDITQQNTRHVDVIEVRLVADPDAPGTVDQLSLDDRAWAIVPPDRLRRILLVSAGDPYLETALTYLPNTEVYEVTPADYGPATHSELFDLIVFEGTLPQVLPKAPILAIAPDRSSPLGEVAGTLTQPGIGSLSPDEPDLRYVDLTAVHIAEARKLVLPDWARTIVPATGGAPLLYVGNRAGLPTAVLAFEPRRSDLPLQVAFPILLANLTGELLGGSGAPAAAVPPGTAVSLAVPAGFKGLHVARPDGTSVDLVPGAVGGATVSFSQADQLGVYVATPMQADGARGSAPPSTGAGSAAVPATVASPSPGTSGGPRSTPRPLDPGAPSRFAVDLFDVDESNIAPGDPGLIEGLASGAGPGSSPAASATTRPGGTPGAASPAPSEAAAGIVDASARPPARDELWLPIVLIALFAIVAEWTVYQRDALIRLLRIVRQRLRRSAKGGTT